MVAQRRNVIGVRVALGSSRSSVVSLVLLEVLLLGFGLAGGGAALLTASALMASSLPDRRSASVDPMAAFRSD